jgi:hypothetical protein
MVTVMNRPAMMMIMTGIMLMLIMSHRSMSMVVMNIMTMMVRMVMHPSPRPGKTHQRQKQQAGQKGNCFHIEYGFGDYFLFSL